MRIAIITEVSTSARNPDVMAALEAVADGHRIFNVGMKGQEDPELTIVETGFLSGLLLNLGACDLVIGGCGTGQGYMNCAAQYPGVVCGLLDDPLSAFLFPQINDGNCISLALNKGYGWGGNVNLGFILERLLAAPRGAGYPDHRKEPQKEIRRRMKQVNAATHLSFEEILDRLDEPLLRNALLFPGVYDFITSFADRSTRLYAKLMRLYDAKLK